MNDPLRDVGAEVGPYKAERRRWWPRLGNDGSLVCESPVLDKAMTFPRQSHNRVPAGGRSRSSMGPSSFRTRTAISVDARELSPTSLGS